MRDGVAPQIEPAATPSEVYPPLREPALRVGTDVKIFCPFAIGQRIWIRVGHTGLSPVMELGFVAQATMGTRNINHKNNFNGLPRQHRVRQ